METRLEKYKDYRKEINESNDEKALVSKYLTNTSDIKVIKKEKKTKKNKEKKAVTLGQVYRKKEIIRRVLFIGGTLLTVIVLVLIIVFLVGGFNG